MPSPEYSVTDRTQVFNAKLNGGFDHVPCEAGGNIPCAFGTCICRRTQW